MGILYVFEQYVCFVFCGALRNVVVAGMKHIAVLCGGRVCFWVMVLWGGLWGEVDVLWTYCRVDLIDFKAPSSLF